jgi:mRNA interferase HigB
MKVHLIKRQTIEDFVKANVQSKSSFEDWLEKMKHVDLELPTDIQATYGSADFNR